MMQGDTSRRKLTRLYTVSLIILGFLSYFVGWAILIVWRPLAKPKFYYLVSPLVEEYYGLCNLVILGFDVLWVLLMVLCKRINIRVRAALVVSVLALSVSFLSWMFIAAALAGSL